MPSKPGLEPQRHHLIPRLMSDVTDVVMGVSAAGDDLRLGGASALGEFYLGHRISLDLDFFAMEPGRVELVGSELSERLPATGLISAVEALVPVGTGLPGH
jgi:hypothetical protein